MTVPYIFASATAPLPLSQLDSNFATAITLGSTSLTLGSTVTSVAGLTLTSATISSLSSALSVANGGTGLTTLTAGYIPYGNGTNAFSSSANITFNGTTLTLANDASISGLTVGKGGGSYSTSTSVGTSALVSNTTGGNNTAIGNNALNANISGNNNTAVGDRALRVSTATSNTGIGNGAMYNTTSGGSNTAVGDNALFSNTTASNNTAVGYQAGYSTIGGGDNTYLGRVAGYNNTTGTFNTFVGDGAGYFVSSGGKNSILGSYNGNQGSLDIRTASNYIVLSDGDGNPRQIIDGSGNVGIGVTPSAWSGYRALQIGSTTSLWSGTTAGTNASSFYTNNGYFNGANRIYLTNGYATEYIQGQGQHIWYNAASGTAGNAITFTTAMTLDTSGNLTLTGPNTNYSPNYKFGMYKASSNVALLVNCDNGYNAYLNFSSYTGKNSFGYNYGSSQFQWCGGNDGLGTGVQMALDSSGNLLVGTTSTNNGAKLSVTADTSTAQVLGLRDSATTYANNDNYILFSNSAGNTVGGITHPAVDSLGLWGYTSLRFITQSGAVEAMRIDSSGNLLVGTTTQFGSSKVTVSSGTIPVAAKVTGTSNQTIFGMYIIKPDNDTTTSQRFIGFGINNDASGSGQINANGANSAAFGSYSDIRLKENIVDLPSQINNILALKPKEFDYKTGGHQIGFIAQEMQEIYPDVVGQDETGMMTITGWSKTEARLVKAIQEQQALIESLTQRIATLENK